MDHHKLVRSLLKEYNSLIPSKFESLGINNISINEKVTKNNIFNIKHNYIFKVDINLIEISDYKFDVNDLSYLVNKIEFVPYEKYSSLNNSRETSNIKIMAQNNSLFFDTKLSDDLYFILIATKEWKSDIWYIVKLSNDVPIKTSSFILFIQHMYNYVGLFNNSILIYKQKKSNIKYYNNVVEYLENYNDYVFYKK